MALTLYMPDRKWMQRALPNQSEARGMRHVTYRVIALGLSDPFDREGRVVVYACGTSLGARSSHSVLTRFTPTVETKSERHFA